MFFKRYCLNESARASYLIADEITRLAAVVDPQANVTPYELDSALRGFQIRYVFRTHADAGSVAGSVQLHRRVGASIYLSDGDAIACEYTTVQNGDVIEVGYMRLCVLQSPNRSTDGISILIYDLADSDRAPVAMLTGDTLLTKERTLFDDHEHTDHHSPVAG